MTIGQGSPINKFGAIPSVSLANEKVMAGRAFSVRKRFDIPKTAAIDLVFDPTAFTGLAIVTLPLGFDAIAGPILIDIYSGATADDNGTLIPIFNRDFSNGSPSSVIRLDPTNIDISGLTPIEYFVPSDGLGATITAGSSVEPLVANLDISKKMLIRLTNTDTVSDAIVGVKFDFFEVL